MPNKKHIGKCDCRHSARKTYSELTKVRKDLTKRVLPLLRKLLHRTADIDRAIDIIAAELRRQQVDESGT